MNSERVWRRVEDREGLGRRGAGGGEEERRAGTI